MGLFGKLFEKKTCDICGGEIGLLGNRKMEDGNLCKNCNKKLSPFFDERRHSTVADIREHLAYREANKDTLAHFKPTRTLGDYHKLYVDEAGKTFVMSFMRNWRDENPDVVPMSEIADVHIDISDYKNEIKREVKNSKGETERVSYNPPHYTYSYNFYAEIVMKEDFKWFNKIRMPLNNSTIDIDYAPASGFLSNLTSGFDPRSNPKYNETERLGQEVIQVLMGSRASTASTSSNGDEMVECEYCGSRFAADGSGKCPYCGANVR